MTIGNRLLKNFNVLLLLIVCVSILTGCGETKKEEKVITYNIARPPGVIDPQVTTRGPAFIILSNCMEGLVRLGEKPGEVLPGVAKSWEYSDEGKTLTFKLRKDAKWSNGETIKASEFYNATIRALEPITAYAMSNMLYCINNAQEFNTGKIKDPSKVGVKVIDDYTIEFSLNKPTPYFLQILALPWAFPLNKAFYDKVGSQYAQGADKLLYNGPWKITNWIGESEFDFEKNDLYWNKNSIKLNKLKFILVEDLNTAANMYRNNRLDITSISGTQLPLFKNDKGLRKTISGVWYIVFNLRNKIFQNEKIRRAIGMAINREILCNSVKKDGSVPAYALIPNDIAGGNGKDFRDRFGEKQFEENITLAQKLFKEGLEEIGHKGPVKLSLTVENTSTVQKDGIYIQEQLRDNLGIDLELKTKTYVARLNDYALANYDMMYTRWGPDYNDPMTFLDLWISGPNNRPNWLNKKYDELIKTASNSNDNDIRMKAMYEAETLLMKEMPIVPIYFTANNWLVKPWIKNFVIRTAGTGVSFYWAEIEK